jgi:hypothetical protein
MGPSTKYQFSEPVSVFHDRRLPEPARPVGYAALIEAYGLLVPLPRRLAAIGTHHKRVSTDTWTLFTPRHAPENTLAGHLTFALKWEGADLLVLKRLFRAIDPKELIEIVQSQPTGGYARRIWFFYEWLTGEKLPLPDARRGSFVGALDPIIQFTSPTKHLSPRHRIRNNLPGSPDFCPLVFRTKTLERAITEDLASRAREVIAPVSADVLARAAAFLMLEDSRSSFAIEGEQPPSSRIARWGQAIGQAGRTPLDLGEILRLQRLVLGESPRFITLGLRSEGGFVGQHDRQSGAPIPFHISARPEDLPRLMDGLIDYVRERSPELDPVIAAAAAAFGFVYIHPFSDGNGRIHRYLIHHVLAERDFNPPGLVFPVSAAILRHIDAYRDVLETHSQPILPLIQWEATEDNNVRVLNDSSDFYRFFDATPHAEFLYRCVKETIEKDLPHETSLLQAYDCFTARIQELADMPSSTLDLLFRFLRQNNGAISKRAREREFAQLTDDEVEQVEAIYREEIGEL